MIWTLVCLVIKRHEVGWLEQLERFLSSLIRHPFKCSRPGSIAAARRYVEVDLALGPPSLDEQTIGRVGHERVRPATEGLSLKVTKRTYPHRLLGARRPDDLVRIFAFAGSQHGGFINKRALPSVQWGEMNPESAPASEMSGVSNGAGEAEGRCCQTGEPLRQEISLTLSPLQKLIVEILNPLALGNRTTKEWRSLYRSFVAFFAQGGEANETERKAWETAFETFNRNLVAVQNRVVQVVPMTFQDCLDAIDSFKHDGLIENGQRDIVWQPKKILLLMASMIGRILAGWHADRLAVDEARQDLSPLQLHLIDENRKGAYLGYIFSFDPCFGIDQYRAAGLEPVLRSFPHCADALVENGVFRCQAHPSSSSTAPSLLELHFRRPLREPLSARTLTSLKLFLCPEPGLPEAESDTRTLVGWLAFEAQDPAEAKWSKIETLFEYALAGKCFACSSQRATVSAAATLARTLGRTQAEQFVIEQFFALGFQSGAGNEPWLEKSRKDVPETNPDRLSKAREKFRQWKGTFLFFENAGQPEAAGVPGARLRQEMLQPKGSNLFFSLSDAPAYRPLVTVAVMVDSQGKWLLDERDFCVFAKSIHAGVGKTLLDAATVVRRCTGSLADNERKAVSLFECALGILLSVCGGHNRRCLANIEGILGAMREKYEAMFQVSLADAPSLKRLPRDPVVRLAEARKKLEAVEQRILGLVREPLDAKASPALRDTLAVWYQESRAFVRLQTPTIQLQNQTAFEESVTGMCAWIDQVSAPAAEWALASSNPSLTALAESRILAEEGRAVEALEKAAAVHPALSKTKRQALAPFFIGLSWLLLGAIERQHEEGHLEAANSLVEKSRVLIAETPALDEFNSLIRELLQVRLESATVAAPVPDETFEPQPSSPRQREAQMLLNVYADELSASENKLEKEFLHAVIAGSDAKFQRKEKLGNRLRKLTQWGGREPYKTTLRLLDSTLERQEP